MSFFDNISKQVTNYGQKAVQKTRDVSDSVKINTQISDEERKINNCYTQIGKIYYSRYANNCEEEFSDLIAAINNSELKISAYKKQLQDIKGVDICSKCGAEVSKGAAFCVSCGAPIAKPAPAPAPAAGGDYITCSSCGAAMKKNMRFCTKCGSPLSAPEEKTAEQAVVSEPAEEINKNICPNCGAALEADSMFCTTCGTKVNG